MRNLCQYWDYPRDDASKRFGLNDLVSYICDILSYN